MKNKFKVIDAVKIRWEYEKEGYRFINRTNYLLNFYFPEINMWIVKPKELNTLLSSL